MVAAIWVIAIVEVIRAIQNLCQLYMSWGAKSAEKDACAAFVKSLKDDEQEMVRRVLLEFEKQHNDKEYW